MTVNLKQINNNLTLAVCCGLLFILIAIGLFPSLPSFAKNDLVYCPLQKTWVKKDSEIKPLRQNPLKEICMSDVKKQYLAFQISLKNAFAVDEKGVFETLQKGVKVLDNYKDFPNLPNQNLAELRHSFSIINSKNDLRADFQINSQVYSFQQLSRPPTAQNSIKFDFQFVRALDKISRNINPRSPPFSI